MKLLLDTHVWLWWQMKPERLCAPVLETIGSRDNDVFLSTVSSWEMAIKIAAGKLQLPRPIAEMVPDALLADGMSSLLLSHQHCFELIALPMLHRDPFDRILIAQARVESMTLVTADHALERYDVEILKA